MRTERNKDGSWKVWMTREEYRRIPMYSNNFRQQIAIRLMGDCGLRVFEVLDVTPRHITRRPDGEHFKLEVIGGKDTTGKHEGGKYRETWMPRDLESTINLLTQREDILDDDPLIDRTKRTVQNWVDKVCERTAANTQDSDYRKVSSHDLRRCWANHLLVEENVSPRIVMALGGWSSYDAIEPYLTAPTEENITTTMEAVEL